MRILEIILPVLIMLVLGMACRKLKLLTKSGIDNMKLLVTNIMLPVAIFHALATADYSVKTWKLVGIMFVMLVVSFGVGFLLKPLMNGEYRKYLPFMVSVYEGGLMAYPLYTSLCGQENLSQIAVLDIAGLLFGFSIYMGMLGQVENGEKINAKKLCIPHTGIYCKCAWNPGRTVQGGDLPDRQSLRRCISGGGRDPYHIRDSNHSDRCGI